MRTTTDPEVSEGWGPSVEGRHRRLRLLRWVLLLLVAALVVLLAVTWWASRQIPRLDVDGLAGTGRPMHVLLVGSDSREGLSEEERRELTTGSAEGERSDTILLLTIRGRQAALLSFPRDLWVERCDGSTGRINVAVALGGPSCLVQTVRDVSGIPVNHYVEVTFGGFRDAVDAVGGVEMCLPEPIADVDAGIDLPAGCQNLGGADALGYVRVRKIDDDLGRIERQQTFVRALAREVATPATLLNPLRVLPLVTGAGDAIAVDRGLGLVGLARLGWGAQGLAAGTTISDTVPADPVTTAGGAMVLEVDETAAEPVFARHRDGSVLDETSPETTVRRSEVTVAVLNAAQVDGLAGRIGDLLAGRGFDVGEVGNADTRDTTVVRYPPGSRAEAQLVAGDLPAGGTLEETNEVTVVTVVLGRDAVGP